MKSPLHERPLITEEHEVGRPRLTASSKDPCEDMTDTPAPDDPAGNARQWFQVPSKFRTSLEPLPEPWEARFGPLRQGAVDHLVVVGKIGKACGAVAVLGLAGHRGDPAIDRLTDLADDNEVVDRALPQRTEARLPWLREGLQGGAEL